MSARPLKADLGILGKKWTLSILADIEFRKVSRFSQILHSNPSLTPRMLSRRLKELERGGIIFLREPRQSNSARNEKRLMTKDRAKFPVDWKLTQRGSDLMPAVMNLIAYNAKWSVDSSFRGRLPKRITPQKETETIT